MKAKTNRALFIALTIMFIGGLALAAEGPRDERNAERPDAIAPGSPHRSHELAGLPHIELSDKQIDLIEAIVKNNEEGVKEVNMAVREAEKALRDAIEAGRTKLIEAAALSLGEAIGQKAVLDVTVVNRIKHVLTERQLVELEKFNARSKLWQVYGKLQAPATTGAKDEDQDGQK